MQLSQEVRDVAQRIGQYYLHKYNAGLPFPLEGDYEKAEKEIRELRISKIEIEGNKLIVTTARPGLFIGRRGQNVDALSKYLQMELHVIEEMDPLEEWLIPRKEEEY